MPTVEEMRVVMDAETARLHSKLLEADRRMAQFQAQTAARLKAMDGYFRSVGAGLGVLTSGLGAAQITEFANSWTRVERALRASEDVFGMRLMSSEQLVALANEARIDLEAYAKTYTRTAAAIRDYGYDSATAAKFTSSLSKALKLGAATSSEQASVLLQVSQALQKGKLDGDEFRSVMENAGVVQELLAERMKVSKGEIVSMAKEGRLKVKDLVGALTDGADKIDRVFRQTPATVDEAFTVLRNAAVRYVGTMDQATGASRSFVSLLAGVANNIDTVGNSALVMSAALLAAFGPRMLASVAGMGVAVGAAMGPIGAVSAIIAGGAAALQLFGDKVAVSADGLITVKDVATGLVTVIGAKLTPLLEQAGQVWQQAVGMLTAAMAGVPVSLDDMMAAVRAAANATVGLFAFAGKAVVAAFTSVPPAVAELFVAMANSVISTVEAMVGRVAEALSVIPGIKIETQIDFGRLRNPFDGAGARAREDMRDAGRQLGRDFVGEFAAAANGISAEVEAAARKAAEARIKPPAIERKIDLKMGKPPFDEELYKKQLEAYKEMMEVYKKALDATGEHVKAVQAEYEKDLAKYTELHRKKIISTEEYNKVKGNLQLVAVRDTVDAAEKEAKGTNAVRDARIKALEATEQYVAAVKLSSAKELHEFEIMLAKKEISERQFQEARGHLARTAQREINEAMEKEYKRYRETTDVVASSMADAFAKFAESGKLSVSDMVRSMLLDIAKLIFKVNVLNTLFGESGKGFGVVGSLFGVTASNAAAGTAPAIGTWATTTSIPGYAVGGRPDPGMPAWVGERGPELWIPDRPGTIVPNHDLGRLGSMAKAPARGDSTSVSINLSIDARGATVDTLPLLNKRIDTIERNLPRMIIESVGEARDRRVLA